MNGSRHDKYTKTMPLEVIVQDQEKGVKIKKLIQDFFKIIDECKANVSVHEKQQYVSKLKSKCIEWGLGYAHLFGTDQITPYIHVFSTHLFEFFDHFGNLNTFSLQGVERLNELLTRDYFVGSNKKGEYFRQMLKRRLCQMLLPLTRTQLAHLRDAISKQRYDVDYETPDEEEESLLDIIDFNGSFDHKSKGESSTFPVLIEEFEFETVIPCRYKIIDNYSGGEILYNGQWAFDTREEVDAITKKSRLV
ncbi:unnamed protein product [Didymodactylos carnosus]|uniref:Uncharacterized protein n=1 Tax=Didymodactylos carnosus TaxID=1234261 RepID=A0A8S2NZI0_9BILA|nr:unnamed protein product [Didymodactylos carnosus]CAF4020687.1 unnamed protein product [Didymodactylos carnosus]